MHRYFTVLVMLAIAAASKIRVASAEDFAKLCATKCNAAKSGTLDGERDFNEVKAGICNRWNKQGVIAFRACDRVVKDTATKFCSFACEKRQHKAKLMNNWQITKLRTACDVEKSKRPYPTLYNACKAGMEETQEYYGTLGYNLRIAIEECKNEDSIQQAEAKAPATTTTESVQPVATESAKPETVAQEAPPSTPQGINNTVSEVVTDPTAGEEKVATPKLRASAVNPGLAATVVLAPEEVSATTAATGVV